MPHSFSNGFCEILVSNYQAYITYRERIAESFDILLQLGFMYRYRTKYLVGRTVDMQQMLGNRQSKLAYLGLLRGNSSYMS